MTLTKVEKEITISKYRNRERAWNIISDFAKYPEIMKNVEQVNVIERNEAKGKSEWHVKVEDAPITWIEEDFYDKENGILSFKSIEGDLEIFNGRWELTEIEGGMKIKFSVEYYLGIPVLEDSLGPILKEKMQSNIDEMLSDIEKRITMSE
jgi:ribosome-associated toxin RatA of RatAB toxin-antitoxin module